MELLAALDEVGIPVHEEFIWPHFVDNLPPGYKFIKSNLQGSKEPLKSTVLEDALRSRYNIQSGGEKRILHCSCLARRVDGEGAAVEAFIESRSIHVRLVIFKTLSPRKRAPGKHISSPESENPLEALLLCTEPLDSGIRGRS